MWPLLETAIDVPSSVAPEAIWAALTQMAAEDPSMSFGPERETRQPVIRGQDEAHLERLFETLWTVHEIPAQWGPTLVCWRETITRPAEIVAGYRGRSHTTQVAGVKLSFAKPATMVARVKLRFEPAKPGSGFVIDVADNALPDAYRQAVVRALEWGRDNGVLIGAPMIDMTATLVEGDRNADASVAAFEAALREAFDELRDLGATVLLEPVMHVVIVTPAAFTGAIIADLDRRGATEIRSRDARDGTHIDALAPLSNLIGYRLSLGTLSNSRARLVLRYDHYAPVPDTPPPDDTFPGAVGKRA